MVRRILLGAAAALALLPAAAHAAAPTSCDLVAAPTGNDRAAGTTADPLRTPQAVIDRLGAGQTGCLRAGVYRGTGSNDYVLRFGHGGTPGHPLTLRSFPGETATLSGITYVTKTAPDVTISDLSIDDPTTYASNGEITFELNAARTTIERNTITNHRLKTCMLLGTLGYGRARGVVIRDNVFHDCGDPANHVRDHAIYISHATGTKVLGNVITHAAAYAVHMYSDAQDTLVRNNLMIDNGGGVIFAGEGDAASSHNTVVGNVIGGSSLRPDISSYWDGRVGRGNVARRNCLMGGAVTDHVGFSVAGNIVSQVRLALSGGVPVLTDAEGCAGILPSVVAGRASRLGRR